MALFVEGMICSLCGRPMYADQGQAIFSFQPFVSNEADPLFQFNDASFHAKCLRPHPLYERAMRRNAELARAAAVWPPHCTACGYQIESNEDYFGLAHITDTSDHPLFRFNHIHLHKACLIEWSETTELLSLLRAFHRSGQWSGPGLEFLIHEIESAVGTH